MRNAGLGSLDAAMRVGLHGVALLLAVMALAGCVVARPYGYAFVPYGYVEAPGPPPAPPYEVVGVAPNPGDFWIAGSWGWVGGRYVWRSGYWQAPRPGYRWVPQRWSRLGSGWRAQAGHWEHR